MPTSAPIASTSGSTRSAGVTPSVGSTRMVVPRASLLWNPLPTLTKNSVSLHGPRMSEKTGTHDRIRRPPGVLCEVAVDVEVEIVGPQSDGRTNQLVPVGRQTRPDRVAALHDGVLARDADALSTDGSVQADGVDIVAPHLDADGDVVIQSCRLQRPPPRRRAAVDTAVIELFELIAVVDVGRVGEVREQIQSVVDCVRIGAQLSCADARRPVHTEAVAMRIAAVGRIDEPEAVECACVHCTLRNLIRRTPFAFIPLRGYGEATGFARARIPQQCVGLPKVLFQQPGPVGLRVVDAEQQRPIAHLRGGGEQPALIAVLARLESTGAAHRRCRDNACSLRLPRRNCPCRRSTRPCDTRWIAPVPESRS